MGYAINFFSGRIRKKIYVRHFMCPHLMKIVFSAWKQGKYL